MQWAGARAARAPLSGRPATVIAPRQPTLAFISRVSAAPLQFELYQWTPDQIQGLVFSGIIALCYFQARRDPLELTPRRPPAPRRRQPSRPRAYPPTARNPAPTPPPTPPPYRLQSGRVDEAASSGMRQDAGLCPRCGGLYEGPGRAAAGGACPEGDACPRRERQ